MKPSLQILDALEAAYQQSFSEDIEPTFTEVQALRSLFETIDGMDLEDLKEEAKVMALFNWRLAQRSCLNTILHLNMFRNILESETIITHLYRIRNDQTRDTIAEIKAEFLDRTLEEFLYELDEIVNGMADHEAPAHIKLAFMNCDANETIHTAMELAGKLLMLDSDLKPEYIELTVQDDDDDSNDSISSFTLGK